MTWRRKKLMRRAQTAGAQLTFSRDELATAGFKPGDYVEVSAERDRIVIKKSERVV